jgi:hypothetical protein
MYFKFKELKKIILHLACVCLIAISCNNADEIYNKQISIDQQETDLKKYKEIATVLLSIASQNQEFYNLMRSECAKQQYGDYYVRLNDIIKINQKKQFWSQDENEQIIILNNKLEKSISNNVIIFIPSVETDEDIRLKKVKTAKTSLQYSDIAVVFMDEYLPIPELAPGYLVTNEILAFDQMIDEEYAWENDVWVIGQEEVVSASNMQINPVGFEFNPVSTVSSGGSTNSANNRTEGRQEFGGRIQITDLGKVEPWISGKLELKYFVFNTTGTNIKERAFGKTKRKHFKDKKWYDYNDFIVNWNNMNVGNWNIESWIEEDGGSSSSVSQTFPAPSGCIGCPSTTITHPSKSRDDILGRSMVQYSDNITQIYNISYANFTRK